MHVLCHVQMTCHEQRWAVCEASAHLSALSAVQMQESHQYYGMTALLDQPLQPTDGLVLQYEVKFSEGHKCGGAYLKLLSARSDGAPLVPEKLKPKTPFSIMFGPDRCASATKLVLTLVGLIGALWVV